MDDNGPDYDIVDKVLAPQHLDYVFLVARQGRYVIVGRSKELTWATLVQSRTVAATASPTIRLNLETV